MIHKTVELSSHATVMVGAHIGARTKVWANALIGAGAQIGEDCIISMGVIIEPGAVIGNKVKIQNGAVIYNGVTIEDGVFIGPHVVFTNDLYPRAVDENFELITNEKWELKKTLIRRRSSIGANATILCGIEIGECARIGAGSVLTKTALAGMTYVGNPARPRFTKGT